MGSREKGYTESEAEARQEYLDSKPDKGVDYFRWLREFLGKFKKPTGLQEAGEREFEAMWDQWETDRVNGDTEEDFLTWLENPTSGWVKGYQVDPAAIGAWWDVKRVAEERKKGSEGKYYGPKD